MSSARLPGKVLAPLYDSPMIRRVFSCLEKSGFELGQILLVTSLHESDDPLAEYVRSLGISVFRGSLGNVVSRFLEAEKEYPCNWIIRVTGDSPFLSVQLLEYLRKELQNTESEFITTTYRRTLPKGINLEAFSSKLLRSIGTGHKLDLPDREHLTSYWHNNIPDKGLTSIELEGLDYSGKVAAIDTLTDLEMANEGKFEGVADCIPWERLISRRVTR